MRATPSAFDAAGVAFAADHAEGERLLAEADLDPLGFISSASNGTMLCRLGPEADNRFAVYKPGQHERPLWDFPGELYLREVAAYVVSEALGWQVVPPTVLRDGPRGPGSVQLFVPHDPAQHYFALVEAGTCDDQLVRLAMFDMVTNNADRKGGHVLRHVPDGHLYGIDNGLSFHTDEKLRTVIWDLPHVPFPDELRADLRRLDADIRADGPLAERLHELLTVSEVRLLARRAAEVADMDAMPDIPAEDRWYPWPPI
jgi:uncharacterized repeat protein (TIGR03843 family)